jgi:hypothetical protein
MRSRTCLLVVAVAFMSGCGGSSPTSPSSATAAAPLPESIEMISESVSAGTTLRHTSCHLGHDGYWDLVSCFEDLYFKFAVRYNRDATYARLWTEFRTSDGRVCGETFGRGDAGRGDVEISQPVVAGVVATFQTSPVYLKPDCWDLLPFKTVTVLARVTAGSPPVELMKQEFAIGYTFVAR